MTGERRRAPRVDLVGQLRGELVSVDLPIVVREISLGGMSIETSEAFEIESRHSFVLTLGDGAGVSLCWAVSPTAAESIARRARSSSQAFSFWTTRAMPAGKSATS
jgi:hypothetical protein